MTEVNVKVTTGVKCPRCWCYHYLKDTFDNLCDRCTNIMINDYPDHQLTTTIKELRSAEKKKYCARKPEDDCPHENCCRKCQ